MQCTAGWYQGFVFASQILQKGIPIGKTDHIPQAGYPAVINIHFAEFFQDGIHLVPGNIFVIDYEYLSILLEYDRIGRMKSLL